MRSVAKLGRAGTAVAAGAALLVIVPPFDAVAAPGDQIAPISAVSSSSYEQPFARSDDTVTATYSLAGPKLRQNPTSTTAPMNTRGSNAVFSPSGVANATGAQIDNLITANCAGGNGTATDCGTSGTITVQFARPVTDPTLHVAGLGGQQTYGTTANPYYANFATYLTLTASTSSTAPSNSAALGPLLGTPTNLQLANGRLQTSGFRPGTSCDNNGTSGATSTAGCGSVQVSGTNLTSLTLTVGLRNSGAAIDTSQTTGQLADAFLLDTSIPDVSPALRSFECTGNSIYGVDQSDFNINRIDVDTGAETFVGHVNAAAGTSLNGLAITAGGTAAYAINRNVAPGGATTIYRLDPTTNTSTAYTGPTLAQTTSGSFVVEGALNPATGVYYFGLVGGDGLEIYGFNTATNTPIVGRIAHVAAITGGNGDLAFDRLGRMVFIASSGDGTSTANPLYYVKQPLPTTGVDAEIVAALVGHMEPDDSTFNGLAFELPSGHLYVTSSTGGQSMLRQLNPTSGAEVTSHAITYLGQSTNEVGDLASCSYNNSVQLQTDIVGRVAPTDQFTTTITGGGLRVPQTGTTSGSTTGPQQSGDATAGPFPALAGSTYTITQTPGNGTTKPNEYVTTWACVDLLNPGTPLASGAGSTGVVTFPTPTNANGIPLGCTFRNEPIESKISITKITDRAAYHEGETVRYTITVKNTGNSKLTDLQVTDATTASCERVVGTLAAGADLQYSCTATAPVTNNANTASVSGKDPNNVEVRASATTPVTTIRPALQLLKTADPTSVTFVGDTVTYTFDVANTGDSTISDIAIADTPVAPSAGVPNSITCLATTLIKNTSTTCSGTYAATAQDLANRSIKNRAVATGRDVVADPVSSNPSVATVTVLDPPNPAITVEKTPQPTTVTEVGQQITYSFLVTNTGNVPLTDVAVTDTFTAPAGPAPLVGCPQTSLAPTKTTTCSATYTSTQADFDRGRIDNSAVASGKAAGGAKATSVPSAATVTTTRRATITLQKFASVSDVNNNSVTDLGDTVSWTFLVKNTGTVTLSGVAVDDQLAGPVTCPPGGLGSRLTRLCAADDVHKITQADVDAGTVDNSATASGTPPTGASVMSAPATTHTPVVGVAKLGLTKHGALSDVDGNGIANAGDEVTWTFEVTNSGDVTLTDVGIEDSLAASVTCSDTTLLPGRSTTCEADQAVEVTQADMDEGSIVNTATASGTPPRGAAPIDSPSATATVPLPAKPGLTLTTKPTITDTNRSGRNDAGDTVRWTYVVTNNGNVTLTGVGVGDPTAGDVSCPQSVLAPGASMTCTSASRPVTTVEAATGTLTNTATVIAATPGLAVVASAPASAQVALVPADPAAPGTGGGSAGGPTGSGGTAPPAAPAPTTAGAGTAPLADTGLNSVPLLWLGVWAMLAGLALIGGARIRRRLN